jgi:hypothetical protein
MSNWAVRWRAVVRLNFFTASPTSCCFCHFNRRQGNGKKTLRLKINKSIFFYLGVKINAVRSSPHPTDFFESWEAGDKVNRLA